MICLICYRCCKGKCCSFFNRSKICYRFFCLCVYCCYLRKRSIGFSIFICYTGNYFVGSCTLLKAYDYISSLEISSRTNVVPRLSLVFILPFVSLSIYFPARYDISSSGSAVNVTLLPCVILVPELIFLSFSLTAVKVPPLPSTL